MEYRVTSNTSAPPALPSPQIAPMLTMLAATVPGLTLISKFLSQYLNIDLSQYLGLIVILGGLYTAFSYGSDRAWETWSSYFMCRAEVRYDDEIYNYLMFWVSKNGLSTKATHFVAGTQTNSSQVYTGEDSDDEGDGLAGADSDAEDVDELLPTQYRDWDRMKAIRFTPSMGRHWFRFRGRYVSFTRSQEKEQGFFGARRAEEISLSCFGRDPQILKDLLQQAQLEFLERDGNKTVIYRGCKQPYGGDEMDWTRLMSRPPRNMNTVVLDEAQKSLILDDMKEYLHPRTRKWYSNRGIPYRRGYLLHGPPGTGKTSLCFALAGILRLRIYVASLNAKSMTEDGLAALFRNLPQRCIVLLEDIDAAGLTAKRGKEQDDDDAEKIEKEEAAPPGALQPLDAVKDAATETTKGITLSGFLNIIDGVASSEGRILIMTTNHMQHLDGALLRPGRVDLMVHFGKADFATLKGMFMAIYVDVKEGGSSKAQDGRRGTMGDEKGEVAVKKPCYHHGLSNKEVEALAEEFASNVPELLFTPADVQGYLLRHKLSPRAAVDNANGWVEAKRS